MSSEFASVQRYQEPLAGLVGSQAATQHLASWLDRHRARVGCLEFADGFRAHFGKFTAQPADYAQRVIRVGADEVLAGIRFYGGDASRPFVDVVAWSGHFDGEAMRDAVQAEWRTFAPFALRLVAAPGFEPASGYVDQGLHAARVDAMPVASGWATLVPVTDVAQAVAVVEQKHEELRRTQPALAAEIIPIDRAGLDRCRAQGTLHFIICDAEVAGLIATMPGAIEFLPCHMVVEEIVRAPFNGRGVAAEAQRCLGAHLAQRNPATVLAGTIHRSNHASRISAVRAGRPAVFAYLFIDL